MNWLRLASLKLILCSTQLSSNPSSAASNSYTLFFSPQILSCLGILDRQLRSTSREKRHLKANQVVGHSSNDFLPPILNSATLLGTHSPPDQPGSAPIRAPEHRCRSLPMCISVRSLTHSHRTKGPWNQFARSLNLVGSQPRFKALPNDLTEILHSLMGISALLYHLLLSPLQQSEGFSRL